MKKIMFVCKKNSRRSQMAEGFAKTIGKDQVEIVSAGLEASFIDPKTIEVMKEVGIDITDQSSKSLSDFRAEDFDVVISLCGCGVNLPPEWVTREIFEDWQLDDPEGEGLETYRRIRSEVKERVEDLIGRLS